MNQLRNQLRQLLYLIIFITQSLAYCYADTLNIKSSDKESFIRKEIKYTPYLFNYFKKNDDLYIKNLWVLIRAHFKVDLTEKQIERLSKQMKNAIPHMKLYWDRKFIKIAYTEKNIHEYILSDFNYKEKSFHMNGIKIKFDKKKNFSENIQEMSEFLSHASRSNLPKTVFSNMVIKDSHAFIGLILKGLALVLAVLVVPAAVISFDAQIMESDFEKLKDNCEADIKQKVFKFSNTDKFLENLLLFSRYSEFFEKMAKYKNCLLYVQNEEVDGRFSKLQLDSICQLGKEAYRCIEEYQKLKKQEDEKNNSEIIRPVKTKTSAQGIAY